MNIYWVALCTILLRSSTHALAQYSVTSLSKLLSAIAVVLLTLASGVAYGGSIRYDLPNLLGQHVYDGSLPLFNAEQQIDTPFHFNVVEEAKLVVVGRVLHGQAHGDGVIREGTSFELLPSVSVYPNFAQSIGFPTETTPETFRFKTTYPNPFVPDPLPLPGPDNSPPVSFLVYLLVRPSPETNFPQRLDPPDDTLTLTNGSVVDVPIVAEIEQAYIVLSGASIVPEPGSLAMLCGSILLLIAARHRAARHSIAIAGVVTLHMVSGTCRADFIFLAPTPYLSVADSPFPVLTNPTFHLEDFENDPGCVPGPGTFCGGGMFDAPGVNLIHGSTGQGASVDADDGLIDGSGADGASGTSVTIFANADFTFFFNEIEFEFDASELGFLPTAVGFVLTDGAGSMSGLTVYDADGNAGNFDTTELLLDPLTTSDDRFIGIINPNGISRLQMGRTIITASGDFNTPRIDHLQYGLLVPEPSTILSLSIAGVLFGVRLAIVRRRNRNSKRSEMPCLGAIADG